MIMYVVRYKEAEDKSPIRSEFFKKQEQTDKINECVKNGFEVIDTFEGDYAKVIKMKSSNS